VTTTCRSDIIILLLLPYRPNTKPNKVTVFFNRVDSVTDSKTMSSALSRGRDCGRGNDALQLGTHDCTRPECGGVRARTIAAATAAACAAASLVVASAKRRQRLPRERWRRWSYYVILYVFFSFRFCCFFQPIDRAVAARPRPTVTERCDPVVVVVYRFHSLPP